MTEVKGVWAAEKKMLPRPLGSAGETTFHGNQKGSFFHFRFAFALEAFISQHLRPEKFKTKVFYISFIPNLATFMNFLPLSI